MEKAGLEKNGKMVGHSINDMKGRLDEIQRALHEADGTKRWVGSQTYRVTLVVEYLGLVDLDLGCSTILLGQ